MEDRFTAVTIPLLHCPLHNLWRRPLDCEAISEVHICLRRRT